MRRALALAALLPLASCSVLRWPLSSPFEDATAARWCADLTEAQAWYGRITADLDPLVLRSDWTLRYGIARGVVDTLGGRLLDLCAQNASKEEMAYGVSEGAEALAELVAIHEEVASPSPSTTAPLAALSAGPGGVPHRSLMERLARAEAEAKLVLSRQ